MMVSCDGVMVGGYLGRKASDTPLHGCQIGVFKGEEAISGVSFLFWGLWQDLDVLGVFWGEDWALATKVHLGKVVIHHDGVMVTLDGGW